MESIRYYNSICNNFIHTIAIFIELYRYCSGKNFDNIISERKTYYITLVKKQQKKKIKLQMTIGKFLMPY